MFRQKLKTTATYFCHFLTWPLALISYLLDKPTNQQRAFSASAQLLSLIPGLAGQYLRASFYKLTLAKSSADLSIGFCSFFSKRTAFVGEHVVIGSFSIIGNVRLGDNVLVSSRVSVMSGKYQHGKANEPRIFSDDSLHNKDSVIVGENSWIGEGSIVMDNIGSNCVVSAGSIISKPIPDNTMAAGNPARYISLDKISNMTSKS